MNWFGIYLSFKGKHYSKPDWLLANTTHEVIIGLLLFNSAPQNEAGEPYIGGWNAIANEQDFQTRKSTTYIIWPS